jgi:hypothetical protein
VSSRGSQASLRAQGSERPVLHRQQRVRVLATDYERRCADAEETVVRTCVRVYSSRVERLDRQMGHEMEFKRGVSAGPAATGASVAWRAHGARTACAHTWECVVESRVCMVSGSACCGGTWNCDDDERSGRRVTVAVDCADSSNQSIREAREQHQQRYNVRSEWWEVVYGV